MERKPTHRSYWVLQISELLFRWLNEHRDTPAGKRVEGLLTKISEYTDAVAKHREMNPNTGRPVAWGAHVVAGAWEFPTFHPAVDRAGEAVARAFRRYLLRPEFVRGKGGKLLFDWEPAHRVKKGDPEYVGTGEERFYFTECHAVARIIELCQAGLIEAVRRCPCGKWFCAKFSHSKFCSTSCQQKIYRSSPEWREYRRNYMRRLRLQHKQTLFRSTHPQRKLSSNTEAGGVYTRARRVGQ